MCRWTGPGFPWSKKRPRGGPEKWTGQTTWDAEGYAIRDPGSTTYTGRIETAAEFGNRIYLEAWNRGCSCAEKIVAINDGAEWIWNLIDQHFPGVIQIVDLFHARQHLWELARLRHPGDNLRQEQWILRHQPKLDGGKIEKLVRFLRGIEASTPSLAEAIRTEAAYLSATPSVCATPSSGVSICLLALASSKPAARL